MLSVFSYYAYYSSAEMLLPKEVFVLKIQDGWIIRIDIVYGGVIYDLLQIRRVCCLVYLTLGRVC